VCVLEVKMCVSICGVGNWPLMVVVLFMKSSVITVDEGGGGGGL